MPGRLEAGGRRRGGKSMAASAVAVASGTPAGLAWKKRVEPHQQPAPPAPTQPKQTLDTASAAATQPPKALDVAVVPLTQSATAPSVSTARVGGSSAPEDLLAAALLQQAQQAQQQQQQQQLLPVASAPITPPTALPQQPLPAIHPQLAASATAMRVAAATLSPTEHSGEDYLMEMLANMDQIMQQGRQTQQGLVAIIELSCRKALDGHFGRLMLVGSAALRVETPGSDIDIVCFTQRRKAEASLLPAAVLRRVHRALKDVISQYVDHLGFYTELIDDARVPILRVLWGPPECAVVVDVSVDQSRPVDHVRWFQRAGAAPRNGAPEPMVAPLVTLTLRCVKWWLRQRQIPRTKEGGLPTLAWLLMVVHVCSLPETHNQAIVRAQRPFCALLASLKVFFCYYDCIEKLDGILHFAADGSTSDFKRHTEATGAAPWAELAVLDPTREGSERLNLVPRLLPATQLLLAYELHRASQRFQQVPRGAEASYGAGRHIVHDVFEPLPEGTNVLPITVTGDIGILILHAAGAGLATKYDIELGVIEEVVPRPGWYAPFLHRSDERSELRVRLCDLDDHSGTCTPRSKFAASVAPSDFVCRIPLERKDGGRCYQIDADAIDRIQVMRRLLADLHQQPSKASEPTTSAETAAATVQSLASIPSPARSCYAQI